MSEESFLTREEELELLRRANLSEDEQERIKARNELVVRNMPLIHKATRQSKRYGFTVEECLGVAVEAWIYSISKHDLRDIRLSTYAVQSIHHKVSRWAGEQCGAVRVPAVYTCGTIFKRSTPDIKKAIVNARRPALSTDYQAPGDDGDDFASLGQQIPFRDVEKQPDGPSIAELRNAVAQLQGREADLIRLRLLGCTLEQIGRVFGCTKERIRQIEAVAVGRLRRILLVDRDGHGKSSDRGLSP